MHGPMTASTSVAPSSRMTSTARPVKRTSAGPRRTWSTRAPRLLQEAGYVEVVLAAEVEVVAAAGLEHVLACAEAERGAAPVAPLLALVPAVEAGGDDGDAHLVAQRVVDDRAEDDVGVGMGDPVDDLGRLVHLEQPQVAAAGDVEQDAARPFDRRLEQRAGDGGARRVQRPPFTGRVADAH